MKPLYPRTLSHVLLVLLLGLVTGCQYLSGSDDDDQTATLAAAFLAFSNTSKKSIDPNTGCISGVATTVDSGLPAWIKDNFKCQTITISGSNYVFTTIDYPNHKSYYWGASETNLYEDLPAGNNPAGNNLISAQNIVLTIPKTFTSSGGSTYATGLGAIGVTLNGVPIYSNDAAPGDTLSNEAKTFDNYGGHPQSSGQFHYHAEPTKLSSSDSNLIGIALDGAPVYGVKHKANNGTISTPTLDSNHGHTADTEHSATAIYHYHLATDGTAGIQTLMGDYYAGTPGTSN